MASSLVSQLRSSFNEYLSTSQRLPLLESYTAKFSEANIPQLVQQYSFQKRLRTIWQKEGLAPSIIGDHPDFSHLANTNNVEYFPITTLFMDIESSTRLGILYDPEKVFIIKNAFIRTAIEVVQAFDGHVHRIMGDAIMAFFGNKTVIPEDSTLMALNASTVIIYIVKQIVIPRLNEEGFEDAFGIRIGIDYGSEKDVLWASYGFPGTNEVTATSFFVDVASKLQHSAPRNNIMIGQSLQQSIYFPEELLKVKTKLVADQTISVPYLTPNITNKEGVRINYKQHLLDFQNYLSVSPLAVYDEPYFGGRNNLGRLLVETYLSSKKGGSLEGCYHLCSHFIKKGKWFCFKLGLKEIAQFQLPLKVVFEVENHGPEAATQEKNANHSKLYEIKKASDLIKGVEHWEEAAYRGLHYMKITIYKSDILKYQRSLGIFIL